MLCKHWFVGKSRNDYKDVTSKEDAQGSVAKAEITPFNNNASP